MSELETCSRVPNVDKARSEFCHEMNTGKFPSEGGCRGLSCTECIFHSSHKVEFLKWNVEKVEVDTDTQRSIVEVCDAIKEMLILKNKSYGDSATKPLRLFGKSTALEGLCTRIDDKLNRIYQGESFPGDNDVDDLIGYLVLYKIVKQQED